jgi:hypothetical protein
MPFTFSHPAIVLPLVYLPKRWYSLTGLIIGSLTPDFEYFLRMKVLSQYSHAIGGLFWFDLPIGLLLAFIYYGWVRNSLLLNLPPAMQSRFLPYASFNWNQYFKANWLVVVLCILVGAASHLLWDSFTHEGGYFVELLPRLSSSVNLLSIQIPLYKLLQHLSSLIGALILAYTLWSLPKTYKGVRKPSAKYWMVIAGIAFFILAIRLLSGLSWQQYGSWVVSCIAAVILAFILAPLFYKKR